MTPKPLVVHVKVPSPPLPPKLVKVPYKALRRVGGGGPGAKVGGVKEQCQCLFQEIQALHFNALI